MGVFSRNFSKKMCIRDRKQDEQARQESRKEASKVIFDADTLTTELAELLIDRVLVYPDTVSYTQLSSH